MNKKRVPEFVALIELSYYWDIFLRIIIRINMKIQLSHRYNDVIELNNLYLAWAEFSVGKANKKDVQEFAFNLFDNIASLRSALLSKTYEHDCYHSFYINDPKRRHIHKARVRDRLLHHAIYRLLYPFFERTFVVDSYSCRLSKGVYKAISSLDAQLYKISKNNRKTCWMLKFDIKKFFDSIDHKILLDILSEYIPDQNIMSLLTNVIDSFHSERRRGVGLPLGNLTSQLFSNVYLNVFDHWIKHKLKAKYYVRYADDCIVLSQDKKWLEKIIFQIEDFLLMKLGLVLHPSKIILKTFSSGMDFLGWTHYPHHKTIRKQTKKRMFRKIYNQPTPEIMQSYLGLLSHGKTYKIRNEVADIYWLLTDK